MNLDLLLKSKKAWNLFRRNHPRFPDFLKRVKDKGISEGTDILITVTFPDQEVMKAGLHVKQSDLELLELFNSLR